MQNRIITFGCSFTFGHGLEDCFVPPVHPGDTPSKFAWPSLLANDLGLSLVNNARCGASNLEILYKLLNFKFETDDIVVVMWSFPDRDLIFQNKEKVSVGAWDNNDLVKHWALVHSKEDMATRSWLYIHHASCYLNQNGIKFYNVFANYEKLKEYKPEFLKVDYLPFDMSEKVDYALDDRHPGIKTHQILANLLKERIVNER